MQETIISMTDEKLLKAIEFSVESRMNLESDEQCTIIASPEVVKGIKVAIAKGQIFKDIYTRLIFQENPSSVNPYDVVIIPDSIIEAAIQEQIQGHLGTDQEVQGKLRDLNNVLANMDEELLLKISTEPEENLTEEELRVKAEIQSSMIEVGMNVDLMFTDKDANKFTNDAAIDSIFEKVANENSTISLKGLTNEKEN